MQLITPHAQRERGKVIGRGVHIYIYIYICLWSKKKFESYFRDRLTFSNVDSRTSRSIGNSPMMTIEPTVCYCSIVHVFMIYSDSVTLYPLIKT